MSSGRPRRIRQAGRRQRGPDVNTPQDCSDIADIRAEIDRIDAGLVRLLAERAAYIDRAAVIKAVAGLPARITPRVEQVVANVRDHAQAHGLSPDLVEMLWRRLIDWSIAREETRLGPDSDRKDIR
nr:chorismate mutase [Yoonia sp.]